MRPVYPGAAAARVRRGYPMFRSDLCPCTVFSRERVSRVGSAARCARRPRKRKEISLEEELASGCAPKERRSLSLLEEEEDKEKENKKEKMAT